MTLAPSGSVDYVVNWLATFMQAFTKPICAACLEKAVADARIRLDHGLDPLVRDGAVRVDVGQCFNCEETAPVYSVASAE